MSPAPRGTGRARGLSALGARYAPVRKVFLAPSIIDGLALEPPQFAPRPRNRSLAPAPQVAGLDDLERLRMHHHPATELARLDDAEGPEARLVGRLHHDEGRSGRVPATGMGCHCCRRSSVCGRVARRSWRVSTKRRAMKRRIPMSSNCVSTPDLVGTVASIGRGSTRRRREANHTTGVKRQHPAGSVVSGAPGRGAEGSVYGGDVQGSAP
jgi:hypothetical protein